MRSRLFLFLFFLCATVSAQTVFNSPYTQSWPNIFQSQLEEIDRSISIGHSEIVIITTTKVAKEVETFKVLEMEEKAETIVFKSLNRDGKPVTVIVPARAPVKFIDIYRPSERTGEEEHFRMFVYF